MLLLLLISFSPFECLFFLFLTFCLFENDMNVNESEKKMKMRQRGKKSEAMSIIVQKPESVIITYLSIYTISNPMEDHIHNRKIIRDMS